MALKIRGMEEAIARVRALEQDLARPASFYAANRERYHRQAVEIAAKLLVMLRPQDMDPELWKQKSTRIIDRVTADLSIFQNGIIFAVAEPSGSTDGSLSGKEERPENQAMSFDDIVDWVQAGLDGKPGGKRIKNIDRQVMAKQGIKGVASIVMKAYYSQKPEARYNRLRAAIQKYALGSRAEASTPLLDAIAAAWRTHFAIAITNDLRDWAITRCENL
jgi:hypothetical protein